jgi:hypothetical protein
MSSPDGALRSACLAEAAHLGARLVALAEWDDCGCTWQVVTPDRTAPGSRRPVYERAGPALYQGTAGIALFLTELLAATGDPDVRRTARGALDFALASLGLLGPASTAFGLHSGRVGVAHALARHAAVTGDAWGADQARRALAPLFGHEARDAGLDVIGGAAGAIPVLLQLAEALHVPEARASAVALGEHLVRVAHRWPEGWSWGGRAGGNVRDLTGLAHGAAGCGAALLELWAVTGEPAFRHAAEQAFAYEGYHFDPALGNWPDYRSTQWSELLINPPRLDAFRDALRAGAPAPRYQRTAMSAWCHGAPGVGLTRLRAHALLGDARYADEARTAVHTTQAMLRQGRGNYSLCHGAFGNCETILRAAEHFGEPAWRAEVEGWVQEGLAAHGGSARGWPSGALNALAEPSLLLGDAGVGYFLLWLARPGVPSVLLPVAPGVPAAVRGAVPDAAVWAAEAAPLRAADEAAYFGRTLRAFGRLGAELRRPDRAACDHHQAPVLSLAAAVDAAVAGAPDPERAALLADAARLDRAHLAATRALPDFGDELADDLRRLPPDAVPWASASLHLATCTRLVSCDRDWDAWLADDGPAASPVPPPPADSAPTYVLFRRRSAIHVQRVGPFAAAVLAALAEVAGDGGATADAVAACLLAGTDVAGAQPAVIRAQVAEQLRRAYEAGLVTLAPPASVVPSLAPAGAAPAAERAAAVS